MNPCKTKWQKKWLKLDVVAPEIQEMADEAERFCARWFRNEPKPSLLILVGGFGSGKTHTAKSIFRFCSVASMAAMETGKWGDDHIPSAVYFPWPESSTEFAQSNFSMVQDAIKYDLIVLDDVGAENDPWKICADKLCQILSRREKKFTVLTTNVSPVKWTERFDGRINDRLMRNSIIVDISHVPSYSLNQ